MPYKIDKEKKLIPEELKKSIKLTQKQKQEIRELADTGIWSQRKLAALYGVERTTIRFILNPEKYEESKKRAKENRHKYYSKEKQKVYMKRTREYRKELNSQNKLEEGVAGAN